MQLPLWNFRLCSSNGSKTNSVNIVCACTAGLTRISEVGRPLYEIHGTGNLEGKYASTHQITALMILIRCEYVNLQLYKNPYPFIRKSVVNYLI